MDVIDFNEGKITKIEHTTDKMDVLRIEDMKGGWFIGNFEPTWKTEHLKLLVHDYKKGEQKEPHYHKLGTEINLLLEGKFILRNYDGKGTDQELNKGDVFIIHPYEIASFIFRRL